jgi:4-hydroxybenzoate polyprenyltransferase
LQDTSIEARSEQESHVGGPSLSPPRRGLATVAAAAIEGMRPYQWLKNVLVFAPVAAAHRLTEWALLINAVGAFVAFSLTASALYLVNDLKDAAADRAHPHKRNRPIASGRLPPVAVLATTCLLIVSAAIVGRIISPRLVATLALYLVLMLVYTFWLKALVLLDVFVLAAGYGLRIIAGSIAVGIAPSARLLAFSVFLFVSLALIKRYAELTLLRKRDGTAAHARGYELEDQEFILALGVACGGLSVLVLALYLGSADIDRAYSRSQLIWCTCALLLYWISHMWLMAHRGRMTDDPLVFAIKNRVSVALISLMVLSAWLAV